MLFLHTDWTSTLNSPENCVWRSLATWSSAQEWAKEQLAPNWQAPFKWYLASQRNPVSNPFQLPVGNPSTSGKQRWSGRHKLRHKQTQGIQAELRLVELRVEACLTRLLLDPSNESTQRVDLTNLSWFKNLSRVSLASGFAGVPAACPACGTDLLLFFDPP